MSTRYTSGGKNNATLSTSIFFSLCWTGHGLIVQQRQVERVRPPHSDHAKLHVCRLSSKRAGSQRTGISTIQRTSGRCICSVFMSFDKMSFVVVAERHKSSYQTAHGPAELYGGSASRRRRRRAEPKPSLPINRLHRPKSLFASIFYYCPRIPRTALRASPARGITMIFRALSL